MSRMLLALVLVQLLFPTELWASGEEPSSFIVAPPPIVGMLEEANAVIKPFELKSLDGATSIVSEDFTGKILILDFWATWCSPCVAAFPSLQTLSEMYAENPRVAFLVVNAGWDDSLADAKTFLSDRGYTFPAAYDEGGKVSEMLGVSELPKTLIVDEMGRLRFEHKGFRPGADLVNDLRVQIDGLLNGQEE